MKLGDNPFFYKYLLLKENIKYNSFVPFVEVLTYRFSLEKFINQGNLLLIQDHT